MENQTSGVQGCISCAHKGMKYGPADKTGRRTIELATDAWSNEPLPPLPGWISRNSGVPAMHATPRGRNSTATAAPDQAWNHGLLLPPKAAGQTEAKRQMSESQSEPGLTRKDHDREGNPQVRYLADSFAGGDWAGTALADLCLVRGSAWNPLGLGMTPAIILPGESQQPQAGGHLVQVCSSTVRRQRVVDLTYLEETAHGVEVTGDELPWRIDYYRNEAEWKRADADWRQLTAKDLAAWWDSPDWQSAFETAVSRVLNPQCKLPCVPVSSIHDIRLLAYSSDVYSESHPASAEERAMLESYLNENGRKLGPSDHPVAFVVGILHHFFYLVDATVECLPVSSA